LDGDPLFKKKRGKKTKPSVLSLKGTENYFAHEYNYNFGGTIMTDTIAAIATPPAPSAIGILRLSGPDSVGILDQVFTPARGEPMSERPDRLLVYGVLRDAENRDLDWCLATISRAPNSYTGEDTAELQCHGSPAALTLGLESLFAAGARQAKPGEFTRRAFLNGKLDLTQAEAVDGLIHAATAPAARQAAQQLGGALRGAAEEVYEGLTNLMAHFHAVLDYPDEDIEPFEAAEISTALDQAGERLKRLCSTYRRGRALAEGLPCAIVGLPNAGKSTLFNTLLGYERAIVTDAPGTTRDTVEELVTLGNVPLRLIDTAGVREAQDPAERLGVERSRAAVERSEAVLVLHDSASQSCPEDRELVNLVTRSGKPWLYVETKADLSAPLGPSQGPLWGTLNPPAATVRISAVTGEGMEDLERKVEALCPAGAGESAGEAVLTNARQAEAAGRAGQAVERASQSLGAGVTPDAVLTDVEEALEALGELTGRSVRADITQRIFERFCVGK